jgi:hypothetical protein
MLLRRGVVVAEAPFDQVVAGGRAEVVGPLLRAFVPPQDDRLARVPEGRPEAEAARGIGRLEAELIQVDMGVS